MYTVSCRTFTPAKCVAFAAHSFQAAVCTAVSAAEVVSVQCGEVGGYFSEVVSGASDTDSI